MPDVNALLKSIISSFPNTAWTHYRYLDEGWDHAVIILDEQQVFRFPLDQQYRSLLSKEITILEQLRPHIKLPIPEYNLIDRNYSFAAYPIIKGQALTNEAMNSLASDQRSLVKGQLAEFLTTIHTLDSRQLDLALVSLSDLPSYHSMLKKQAPKLLRNAITVKEYVAVEKALEEVDRLLTQHMPRVFLHGDIYSRHLLWDAPNSQLGIIDFSDMNIGDPAYDFAELYEYGKQFVEDVYDRYQGAKDEAFLRRAWNYQKHIAVYMMIDHFLNHKTSFKIARQTFDRVLEQAYFD